MELFFVVAIVGMLAMFYFGSRKQKKMRDEIAEVQDSLLPGDRVSTTAGLYATVVKVDDITVDLMIADNVVTTWDRRAIMHKIEDTPIAPDFVGELGGDDLSLDDDRDSATDSDTPDGNDTPETDNRS